MTKLEEHSDKLSQQIAKYTLLAKTWMLKFVFIVYFMDNIYISIYGKF